MRISPLALVSNVASVQWIHTQAWATTPRAHRSLAFQTGAPTARATARFASIAPDEVDLSPFAKQDQGSIIAEGPIVSYFSGGFAAVRLEDDVAVLGQKQTRVARTSTNSKKSTVSKGDDLVGRLARLPNGSLGVVIAERPPMAFIFSDNADSLEGTVEIMNTMAEIDVGENMGLVNGFGQPAPTSDVMGGHAIFAPIPKVADIALINSPVLTGTTMVDVLAPIGKGQNMLLIGSNVGQLRNFACDFFKTQSKNMKCVYAATENAFEIIRQLEDADILKDVTVVAARKEITDEASQAAEATLVAGTACAIAESFAKDKGMDALVIVDTLDLHKNFWDSTTRVLVDIYGVDAVVTADREGGASSEMRAFYSSLVQRAANYNKKKGGGSVTLALMATIPQAQEDEDTVFTMEDFEQCGDKIKARLDMLVKKSIPLTAATLRKIQIPIPSAAEGKRRLVLQHIDDLISMSDGQIWLDEDLAAQGQHPPMDPQRSITRIGIGADTQSRADAPAIRRIAEGVRLDLAQSASMDGAEVNAASLKQKRKRDAWLLAMHQTSGGRTLSESCIALLAASIGALNSTLEKGGMAGTEMGQTVMKELFEHVRSRAPDVMREIDETFDITPEARAELEAAILSYF